MGLRFSPECINCVSTFWSTVQAKENPPHAKEKPRAKENTPMLGRVLPQKGRLLQKIHIFQVKILDTLSAPCYTC